MLNGFHSFMAIAPLWIYQARKKNKVADCRSYQVLGALTSQVFGFNEVKDLYSSDPFFWG